MELLKQLIPILLTISLGLVVISVGMASVRDDLLSVLERPRALARATLAVIIIPPITALIITTLFEMPHAAEAALLLMAISPVPPLVPGKELHVGARRNYVYGLYVAMALLSVVTVPLLGALVGALYDNTAEFPPGIVAKNVFVGVIIPLAIGLIIGRWLAPAFAKRVAPMVGNIGMGLVVLAFIPVLVGSWHDMLSLIRDGTVVAVILFTIVAIAGGELLGDPKERGRRTLAVAAAMRHPGIALALASANHADKTVSAAVLLILLVAMITLIPYQILVKRRRTPSKSTA
ncbi:Na+-dependent transporter [Sphingomonas sp. LaA6.9]|uniref:Na+-dependent transporter n=1 Tax=Sphingomonas sp. LaA6.9 TaxID=2919914 RepID=UPI001F4F9458|nr:Na+-dependent transporter [Sphingomonas sp. LaA6.9]MCJ8158086.1 Na+-dependent transporter [Sphingomonas sp. LaA6.9]